MKHEIDIGKVGGATNKNHLKKEQSHRNKQARFEFMITNLKLKYNFLMS